MKLTPARRRALEVLARHPRCRESNRTDIETGCIYWQTVRTFAEHDLIEPAPDVAPSCPWWVLTDSGRQLVDKHGLAPQAVDRRPSTNKEKQ